VQFNIGLAPIDLVPYLTNPLTIETDLVIAQVQLPFVVEILPFFGQFTTLAFQPDGHIFSRIPGADDVDIGPYDFGSLIHLRIDLVGSTWKVFVNDELRQEGDSGFSTFFLEFMAFGAFGNNIDVGMDNFKLCAEDHNSDIACKGSCHSLAVDDCQAMLDCHVTGWKNNGSQNAASQQCAQLSTCSGALCSEQCQALVSIMKKTTPPEQRQWAVDFCNALIAGASFQ
jgi:hypothetical protein